MKITLVTGAMGAGKSRMLHAMKRQKNVFYVDPLAVDMTFQPNWSTPPTTVDAVVFDHIPYMVKPSSQIREAMAWCEANNVPLYLCDQLRDEIESLNIRLPLVVEEIHVRGMSFDITVTQGGAGDDFSVSESRVAGHLLGGLAA